MRLLVVGGGGREHALVRKISQSPLVSEIFCAPGSDSIGKTPKTHCLPKLTVDNLSGLRDFAKSNHIGLTIVGPEKPLVAGIVDGFLGLKIVGPTQAAAQLEGSKVFAKQFMASLGIPTADFEVFDDPEKARQYAITNLPCVIKADGLASGKGVFPCKTREDVALAIKRIMIDKEFKESGDRVVVEDFLVGEEATFMVLTDGSTILPLLATQDHKRVFDGDRGPNTGGMGAYAPAPVITPELEDEIMETIVKPTINGMWRRGTPYKGILYVGLMIVNTPDGPKPMVLEYNVRFGDPELQVILPLMETDLVEVLLAIAEERLSGIKIKWEKGAAVCVVMTSGGYPDKYEPGKVITGLEEAGKMENVVVSHAGTRLESDIWKTAGGRVLGVTAKAESIPEAKKLAYGAVSKISWEDEHHRHDIAQKALQRGVQINMGL
jgi:phosphoribosylamine---glycine ligase